MIAFSTGHRMRHVIDLWKRAQAQPKRVDAERSLVDALSDYERLAAMLDANLFTARARIKQLEAENAFMLRLVNAHMTPIEP